MKRRLVTSALPYVNNIPHLGNLIQVLSADVFARHCRSAGYETLYICGTDEYGTATETKALEEGISPRELCDRYHTIHADIYNWFKIDFDHFGRTSAPVQTEITQDIFKNLDKAGYVVEREIEQLYCADKDMFLADRFVRGECPHCHYKEARGDQCENCGKLLEPTELIAPYSPICGDSKLTVQKTKHLYINLPGMKDKLEAWVKTAQVKGFWANNAIKMTEAWIRDGLKERAITRDLKWGIPVPKAGYEKKVFYVWFDAPIGYISMTAGARPNDWRTWWHNPENVELFQFIGKDNIPFHTVVFPCSLLGSAEGSGERWTMLHHMSSTEYLNYEGGKFSKSAGVGVFGTDAKETGIPADVWRFYLFYNRPESADTLFTWRDFMEKVNSELIGNFSNLVNRTLTFAAKNWDGKVPQGRKDTGLWAEIEKKEKEIFTAMEKADLKDGLKHALELSALGNKTFQDAEPWKSIKTDPQKAADLLFNLCYLVRDLAIVLSPYIPQTSEKILGFFGLTHKPSWDQLGKTEGLNSIGTTEILFQKLEEKVTDALRERFAGSQKERAEKEKAMSDTKTAGTPAPQPKAPPAPAAPAEALSPEDSFRKNIRLKVARIVSVERHPEAEKLYIEKLDCGNGEVRTIVSGLVPYYTAEELTGKLIVLAANLKPAKLRGVLSEGMLLAGDNGLEEGHIVEVLNPDWAAPGDEVLLAGDAGKDLPKPENLKVDTFFATPIRVENGSVKVGSLELQVQGRTLTLGKVKTGEVG